jgi:uncharacterized membrane protein YeaQ/YmgE (transglycosylase-associated protein family)
MGISRIAWTHRQSIPSNSAENSSGMFVAVIGAIVVLVVYHAITGRNRTV